MRGLLKRGGGRTGRGHNGRLIAFNVAPHASPHASPRARAHVGAMPGQADDAERATGDELAEKHDRGADQEHDDRRRQRHHLAFRAGRVGRRHGTRDDARIGGQIIGFGARGRLAVARQE